MPTPRHALGFLLTLNLTLVSAAIIAGHLRRHDPSRYFGNSRPLSFFSSFQLLVVGALAFYIFRERRATPGSPAWWKGPVLWALIAAGFVFLSFDQVFDWHNKLDRVVHKTLHLKPTGWSDRLDDLFVGGYGLIGAGVMWSYRREAMQFAAARKPLFAGFACLFMEVVFDAASNRRDVAEWLVGEGRAASRLHAWLAAIEGVFTLTAEALFIAAFYHAWRLAAAARQPALSFAIASPR